MTDFSVGKTSKQRSVGKYEQLSEYESLKRKYEKFLKQAEKSDLANSPTLNQKKLEMLKQLREIALKESNYADLDMIEDEIEFLSILVKQDEKKAEETSQAYAMPITNKNDLISRFEACKNTKGEIDDETRQIVLAFKDMDVSPRNLSKFVDKCRGLGEAISNDTVKIVQRLCEAKISPEVIFQAADEYPVMQYDDTEIDFSWAYDLIAYKSMGIEDVTSLKLAKKLNKNFENKKDVYSSVTKLLDAGFSPDMVADFVLNFSKTVDGVVHFNSQSINALLTMKKNLAVTRINERNERQNPINKLNQVSFYMDDTVIVMKDNKVVEYIKKGDETFSKVKKDYDDFASEYENKIIQDFTHKYTTSDLALDQNALRVFTMLRNSGVSYDHILPLTEYSLEQKTDEATGITRFGIDVDKVNSMVYLKKSGALSSDILTILNAIPRDKEGNLDEDDVENACALTKMIIAGKDVANLLPEVKNNEDMMAFVSDFSQMMTQKENILPLVQLAKNELGNYDQNASESLYSLAEHFLYTENMVLNEQEFLKLCTDVIASSKSPTAERVDENSATVTIALCRNKETKENILKALELCKDEYGYPNESLADIIWDMSKQKACFTDIVDLINVCKPVSGILDIERAFLIADLLDNNCSVDEVMSFAQTLGNT